MSPIDIRQREEQAQREIGHTAVTPVVARWTTMLLLLTVLTPPLVQVGADALDPERAVLAPVRGLGRGLSRVWETGRGAGFFAANRELLAVIGDFESALEEESLMRRWLLPPVQWVMTVVLGVGNEEAYLGREGWLFYRPGVDYVAGPAFLDPRVVRRRVLEASAEEAPAPDPVPAIVDFHRQLRERGIELIVFPTPVKPMIHPERFSRRFERYGEALHNRSWAAFVSALAGHGIAVFDAAPLLAQARRQQGRPQFLATDTHWTPEALDRVAAALARLLESRVGLQPNRSPGYRRQQTAVDNLGDIAAMLRLPEWQRAYRPERAEIRPVVTADGSPWRPDPAAEVLLLGDSFTNVFSLAGMGWGAGAGLAEQLSYHLGRPVDRIALNAGGSYATRQALSLELARGRDRLAGKRVVVYQFAARELAVGDWKRFELALGAEQERGEPVAAGELVVAGTVADIVPVPRPGTTPYREIITSIRLASLRVQAGEKPAEEILAYIWGMRDNRLTPAAAIRQGDRLRLRLRRWAEVAPEYESYQRLELETEAAFLLEPFWVEEWEVQ